MDLASLIFEEQQCLEVLLRKIAGTILSFMQAHACTVFIANEDSMVSRQTDTAVNNSNNKNHISTVFYSLWSLSIALVQTEVAPTKCEFMSFNFTAEAITAEHFSRSVLF